MSETQESNNKKKINKKAIAAIIIGTFVVSVSIVMIIGNRPGKNYPSADWLASVTSSDFQRESLFIQNGKIKLEADLLIPTGGSALKPAVIFLGGSGPGIYQNYAPGLLEKYVQGVFIPKDFAVLYMNKRGMGNSTGNWKHNDFQGRADDAYAAVQYLKNHPSIDPNNIGLIGHSQGGWIVNLAASQHTDIAFFISLNGPTTSVIEQIEDTYRWDYECQGYEGEELENKVQKSLRGNKIWAGVGKVIPIGSLAWTAKNLYYDPQIAIETVTSPGLFVFSEYDGLVPIAHNLERFDEIFSGTPPSNLNTTVITGANHIFRLVDNICVSYEDSTLLPLSDELVTVLNIWLTNLGY